MQISGLRFQPWSLLLARFFVAALRELMATHHVSDLVRVSWLGQCKPTLQMITLFTLLRYRPESQAIAIWIGYVALYLAAAITVWSMAQYVGAAWSALTKIAMSQPSNAKR